MADTFLIRSWHNFEFLKRISTKQRSLDWMSYYYIVWVSISLVTVGLPIKKFVTRDQKQPQKSDLILLTTDREYPNDFCLFRFIFSKIDHSNPNLSLTIFVNLSNLKKLSKQLTNLLFNQVQPPIMGIL